MSTKNDEDAVPGSAAPQNAARSLAAHERAEQPSAAYLAEAQRLSHTGSFGWKPSTGEIIWSDETFRIFQYDHAISPTVQHVLDRVHPQDVALVRETIDRAAQAGKDFDFEHRLLMPDGSVRHVHVVARAFSDGSGCLEFAGAVMDVTEHHQATAALERALSEVKKSERQLQLVIDTLPTMVWGAQPDGEIDLCNRPLLEYVGETLEQLRRGYSHLLHPEDVTDVMDKWSAALATGKPLESAHRVRGADGVYRWMLVRAAPLHDEQGNIVRWYGASTDIEGRKRAEDEVSRQERELREILDLVPHHIAVAASDGSLVYGNHFMLDYYGLTNQDFQDSETAELARRFTHPDDIEPFLAAWRDGSAGTAPWETEVRFWRRDGHYRWFLIRGTPLRDDGGRTVRWYITGTDIDDRKKAEEKVRQDERELRLVVDIVPQYLIVLADGRVVYANRASLEFTGLSLEEASTHPDVWQAVVHPDDLPTLRASLGQLAEGIGTEVEIRLRRHDGQYRWVFIRNAPLRDDQGRIVRSYASGIDIDDRKRAEERVHQENVALREELNNASMFEEIVGTSKPLRAVLADVSQVAPTDSTVLITGETGTGKELVARAIHKRSSRSSRTFVSVNCAAIPPALIASELFGHEKGAFTGALSRRVGRFELADGGTIFLDEIGDLPLETQLALLRVLQEREFERVGSTHSIKIDVRVIAATNRDLKAAMASGAFREDLFYRLSVFPIEMPPLRKRTTDIPLLVAYFVDRYASKAGKTIRRVDKRTLDLVQSYRWPGNVRELQNVVERAVIVCDTDTLVIDQNWLSRETLATPAALPLGDALVARERQMIEVALAETKGKVSGPSGAAAKLSIPPSTLESKIRTLKIRKDQYKES